MELYYILRNKLSLLLLPVAVLSLVSCGSYQYSGYEADGIYGESRPGIWEQREPQQAEVKPNGNNSYYKDLFAQQSQMVGEALESDVFTDVDSYSSNDGYDNYSDVGGDVAYVGGNAPWGQDPDTYTINIYNNGFNRGFYSPWRYGFNRGFYSPWSFGFGFGDPYFGGWFDPYWGGGYGFPGYGGFAYGYGMQPFPFYNSYFSMRYSYYQYMGYPYYQRYYNNNIAYNTGRRDSRATYSDGQRSRNSYSQRIRDIRSTRSSDYGNSRISRTRGDSDSRVYTRTSRRSEPSRNYENTTRSRTNSPSYERSTRSRSYSNSSRSSNTRSSSSTSRSSSVRSSNSSSRSSSGTTRSSGSRSSRGGRSGGR